MELCPLWKPQFCRNVSTHSIQNLKTRLVLTATILQSAPPYFVSAVRSRRDDFILIKSSCISYLRIDNDSQIGYTDKNKEAIRFERNGK